MSERVHSNIAEYPQRRLSKQYDNAGAFGGSTKAAGVSAPTLRAQTMGRAGKQGIVSFIPLDGGNQNFTLYVWNQPLADVNSGNGWAFNGANALEYTKNCDAKAKISFYITEDEEFCIQADTTPVTELIVSGCESGSNANTVAGKTH